MAPDFSELLLAVDFGEVGGVLLGIAALIAAIEVLGYGARVVLDFVEARQDSEHDRE